MARKRYTPEQIIRLLRQADVLSAQGKSVSEISREIGVSENTYYRWRCHCLTQICFNQSTCASVMRTILSFFILLSDLPLSDI